ncbi:MAG TPA: glycoside hydrolase 43 family protein [Prolixibacteraceae bacterium]|nr:glycoside hydrolase 43 family protein [Prolixibacteraceae bacterium]
MNLNALILCMTMGLYGLFTGTASAQVRNPILPGFYPDPSICRVGKDYYLVNSSFSYFPGVPIFHSTDLIHWKQIGHVLNRASQLNLTNQGISEGIYAPAIRFNKGTFYLITTLIGGGGNLIVTATNPAGPWSDPIWLPEINGIDPSFFFDKNEKAYIINNGPAPDNKPLYDGHRAIYLQEFNLKTMKLTGPRKVVVNGGTDLSKKPIWIEGPHLYQKGGAYYLMAAEGGTGEDHSEVIFKSDSIFGPYESFSGNPILTQRDLPANRPSPITCSGHADLVQTSKGDWVAVFLACQPYAGNFYNTGRQTFMLPVDWSGDWPVILPKGKAIPEGVIIPTVSGAGQTTFYNYSTNWKDDFDQPELRLDWNFIRTPKEKWYELKDNSLIIQARSVSITDKGNPSFIGRRLQHANAEMTTALKLEKGKDMEAGLVAFQNESFLYKLVVEEKEGKYFLGLSFPGPNSVIILKAYSEITDYQPGDYLFLRMTVIGKKLMCFYSLNNQKWINFGTEDATKLSTSVAGGFVGAYFGLYAFAPSPATATFDWASYKKIE